VPNHRTAAPSFARITTLIEESERHRQVRNRIDKQRVLPASFSAAERFSG